VKNLLLFLGLYVVNFISEVRPHGRLIEPPSRSTMWRYGFNTPPNYNDHELYCGGYSRQWRTNEGKCGICGDPWDTKQPRPNEAGGMFGNGIIVRKYEVNQVIKVRVELTANHMGYFEFRVCPNNALKKPASQMCLDKHILKQQNLNGPRYFPNPGNKVIEMHYQLPKDLTCRQCVFQWRYVAGNNWGRCKNGTEAVGCGPQEEFRACADVTITQPDGSADNTINQLVDPEVYVPREDDTRYNEVDFDSEDTKYNKDYDAQLRDEVAVESVVIIVLVSLLVTLLFFGGLFLYYTRGKSYIEKYVKEGAMPSMPTMPTMPSMPKMPKKLTTALNWPLSNVQIKNLPIFLKKESATISANNNSANNVQPIPANKVNAMMAKPNMDPSKRPLPARPPQPPPRVKRPSSVAASAGLSTQRVGPTPLQRPSAPPPAVPATLEIGEPTSVTINGVTVSKKTTENTSPEESQRLETFSEEGVYIQELPELQGPQEFQDDGVIVPATPAMANEDIPDSMQSVPPPPPDCPPPDLD